MPKYTSVLLRFLQGSIKDAADMQRVADEV